MNAARTETTTNVLRTVAIVQGLAIVALLAIPLWPAAQHDTAGRAPEPARVGTAAPADPAATPAADATRSAAEPATRTPAAGAVDRSPAAEGAVLHGRITDDAGGTVPQGNVWFYRGGDLTTPFASVSPRDATYAIAGVPAGPVECRVRATNYRELSATIDVPPGAAHVRHDIVLTKSWVLHVKVLTPDGTPVPDAIAAAAKKGRPTLRMVEVGAVATPVKPEGDFPPTALRELTFGIGRWREMRGIGARGEAPLPKEVAGVLEIDVAQPVWVSAVLRHRVLASVLVEPGRREVVLTVPTDQVLGDLGSIRGRLVDATTGRAATGVRVGFGDLQSGGGGDPVDAEGRFEVHDLRPGLLDIEAYGGNARAHHDLVLLQPGQQLDLGDVPVFPFRAVRGRCEGITGKAENLRVSYTCLTPPPHAAMRRHTETAQVAADGTFEIALLPGRFLLRAHGAGSALLEVDTATLGDAPLVLQLVPDANLRLDVRTNGESWELALFDAAGREVYRRMLRDGWRFALPFPPGPYRAELRDPRGRVQARELQLGAEGVDLRVP